MSQNTCRLLLPKTIYAVVGQEINLYFDNVVLQPYPDHFLFDVSCEHGTHHEDRWFCTPEIPGDFPLRLEVRDRGDCVLSYAEMLVHVASPNSKIISERSLLCIGDSLTAAGFYTEELLALCKASQNIHLNLLGTQSKPDGNSANWYEGYGGWRYETYTTRWWNERPPDQPAQVLHSPFLFQDKNTEEPALDFARYVKEKLNGIEPDYVTLMLGINDVFLASDETRNEIVDVMMRHAKMLLKQITTTLPRAKIGVFPLVPPSVSQDSFGETNGCMQTRWAYLKNRSLANECLMQEFSERESENIYIIPAYLNVDGARHFPTVERTINARNDQIRELFNNEVHPSLAGYLQIADSLFGWLNYLEEIND